MGEQKNLGMGIVLGAMSIGAACFSAGLGWLIETHGWRQTCEVLAGMIALIVPLPLATIRGEREQTAQRCSESAQPCEPVEHSPLSLAAVPFLNALGAGALFSIGMGCIYYHVVPLLIAKGYPTHVAGLIYGLSWLLSAVGSIGLGFVGHRLGALKTLAVALVMCAAGTVALAGAGHPRLGTSCVVVFVVLWGLSANSFSQFIPIILADLFDPRMLGTLLGAMTFVISAAAAVAPLGTGLLYDHFQNYQSSIFVSVMATLLACVAIARIHPHRGPVSDFEDVSCR
jgi:MFS family permease